jgi:ribosome biogenesis GTPase / thiamine phosphate phosphatase
MNSTLQTGLVVAAHGRHCLVENESGDRLLCHPRGKKSQAVVGDRIWWQVSGDEGSIEKLQPRRNLLYRQDEIRTKSFAANLDLVLVLLAAEPEFSENQLTRALIASRAEGIPVLIVLNKRDLGDLFQRAWERLAPYRDMGEQVLPLSLNPGQESGLEALRTLLRGRTTLVLGPSGAGKSTLINRLVPEAGAQTGEISRALNTGKHTTTSTTWYWVDAQRQTALIDSPGFQEFGLHHIAPSRLPNLMPDLQAHLGQCRFYNCSHLHEPGCGVRAAVGQGGPAGISDNRYRLYGELHAELSRTRY